jgi:hypothetical protein
MTGRSLIPRLDRELVVVVTWMWRGRLTTDEENSVVSGRLCPPTFGNGDDK